MKLLWNVFTNCVLLAIVFHARVSHSTNLGTCQKLVFDTMQEYLNSTCGNVVDYEFYLPADYQEHMLNTLANAKLSDIRFSILDPACQESYKRLVCSSIYLKCYPGVSLADISSYNYHVYSDVGVAYPVPFQRPCQSLCTTITKSTSTCWGLINLFGAQPNCSATFDYSNGVMTTKPKLYDATNNVMYCNAMIPSSFDIVAAGTKELYLFQETGSCAGITENIWVPPPDKVSVGLAPIQERYQVQLLMESSLKTTFLTMKSLASPSCLFAARKLFCAKTFIRPALHYLGESLNTIQLGVLRNSKGVNTTSLTTVKTYFPSYPHRSLCDAYQTSCPALSRVPAFTVNCSMVTNGVRNFPLVNQSVLTIAVPGTALKLDYKTAPNHINDAVDKGVADTTPVGTCSHSLQTLSAHYICSDVVDYTFYVPYGASLQSLDASATSKLNSSQLVILPSKCLVAIKKLVCSTVYMKCHPSVVMNNAITWNFAIYREVGIPFPLPIQRPCVSVCNQVNDVCPALLALLHRSPTCDGRYDFSDGIIDGGSVNILQPFLYDQSNDESKCNSASATFEIGVGKEEYSYGSNGFCAGITDDIWIPPGSFVKQLFPNATDIYDLNPPYAVQDLIESTLQKSFSSLPVYLSKDCHFSLRKYFCSKSFLKPEKKLFGNGLRASGLNDSISVTFFASLGLNASSLLDFEFYLPSYPDMEICTDYETHCAGFLVRAKNVLSAEAYARLEPNCSTRVGANGLFTSSSQTIIQLPITLPARVLTISFDTEPNTCSNASDLGYTTQCPTGFVIPEDPNNRRTRMVPGTGCAFACWGQATLLPHQWRNLQEMSLQCSSAGIALITVFLLIWLCSEEKRKQRLVIIFGVSSLVNSLTFIVTSTSKESEVFCSSNSVPMSAADGFTFCYFQSIALTYCSLVNNLAWLMLSVDLFLKISLGFPKHSDFSKIYLPIIFGLPSISVAYAISAGSYGFPMSGAWCFNINIRIPGIKTDQDLGYLFIPMTIFTCLGCLFMLAVIISSIQKIWRNSLKKLLKDIKILKTPIAFVLFGALCWFSLIKYRIDGYNTINFVRSNYQTWVGCVFLHFDGTDSYKEVCGSQSPHMYSFSPIRWQLFCLCGQSIFISAIYLSSHFFTVLIAFLSGSFTCVNLLFRQVATTVSIVRRRTSIFPMPNGDGSSGAPRTNNEGDNGRRDDVEAALNDRQQGSPPAIPAPALESGYQDTETEEPGPTPLRAMLPSRVAQSTAFGNMSLGFDHDHEAEDGCDDDGDDEPIMQGDRLAAIRSVIDGNMGDGNLLPLMNSSQRYRAVSDSESNAAGGSLGRTQSKVRKFANNDEGDHFF